MPTITILDPTVPGTGGNYQLAPRATDLTRGVIGLLDNGKGNAGPFLAALAPHLAAAGLQVWSTKKEQAPGPIGPAPEPLLADLAQRCIAVVNAFGD